MSAPEDALSPRRGPRFLDFPLDVLLSTGEFEVPSPEEKSHTVDADGVARLIEQSERPVIMAGSNVFMDGAENELRSLVERARIPTFLNGQGRGCIPADHELSFARSRSQAFKEADLVVVVGTPFDFRLGFGENFAPGTKVVHLDSYPT